MTKKEKLKKALKEIINYPPKGHQKRTKDGYPVEIIYDEFAYKRIVDSYRDAIRNVLKELV